MHPLFTLSNRRLQGLALTPAIESPASPPPFNPYKRSRPLPNLCRTRPHSPLLFELERHVHRAPPLPPLCRHRPAASPPLEPRVRAAPASPSCTTPLPVLHLFSPCPNVVCTDHLHYHFFTAVAQSWLRGRQQLPHPPMKKPRQQQRWSCLPHGQLR
jgi:hypothetical protein